MTDLPAPSRATLSHASPSAGAPHREIFARFVDRLAARLGRDSVLRRA